MSFLNSKTLFILIPFILILFFYGCSLVITPQSNLLGLLAYPMLLTKAVIHESLGHYERASELYEIATRCSIHTQALHRYRIETLRLAGMQAFAQRNFQKAADYFQRSRKDSPGEKFSLIQEAIAWQKLGDSEHALAVLAYTIEHFPSFPDAYIATANLYALANVIEEAERYYAKAQEINPTNPLIFINKGDAALWRGDRLAARENYLKAIALDFKYPEPHLRMARMLIEENGQPEQIEEHLNVVRLYRSDHPDLLTIECLAKKEPGPSGNEMQIAHRVIPQQRVLFTLQCPDWR